MRRPHCGGGSHQRCVALGELQDGAPIHPIVGMLALFVGLGLEWISLGGIQRSTTRAEASPWLRLIAIVPRLFGTALAAIVVSGFYLGARVGVLGNGWMRASYGALLLMAIVSGAVSRSPMRALNRV